MELCKYCGKHEAIENSHVIPKSVYDWLKSTGPTPYIRSTHNPNKREQDGVKSPLLCSNCEGEFSKLEDDFKAEFFNKVANYRVPCPDEIRITESILVCFYVIAWRVLADAYYFPNDNEYTEEEFNKFPSLLERIKCAIENKEFSEFKTHVIPCTKDVLTRVKMPQVDWHVYERTITAEPRIWDDWLRFVIYIQIPFSIIVFEVVPNENDAWIGTRIEGTDVLRLPQIESVPVYVHKILLHFYEQFLESKNNLSPKQQDLIKKGVENADPNCGSFKTMRKTW
ncbi:hypothetical protein [Vibrio aestuarianus]|uniref:hypothetical protein n=1 Tax=Vibrio aestuarianus TaxID=28171 RepID=UPI00237D2549|nr:hypothetical protein [Vibrio aestuarianus]EGQ8080032.1 hypothetical protein [Vibrio vulnificus]MDE1212002.1 hypothetical protein [Vibrio aestuarianus]